MTMCVATPAQAAMGCWNQTQVAAAKVRDLQSRLMVATLRCQAMGVDVAAAYNRFVAANRTTIQGANGVLHGRSSEPGHGGQAQVHYDRFATALANIYGDDATDRASLRRDGGCWPRKRPRPAATSTLLVTIADRLGFAAPLPGGQCSISFASA